MNIALCNKENNSCDKKESCKRYLDTVGEPMNMLAVCSKDNEYKWYWKADVEIQTKTNNKEI